MRRISFFDEHSLRWVKSAFLYKCIWFLISNCFAFRWSSVFTSGGHDLGMSIKVDETMYILLKNLIKYWNMKCFQIMHLQPFLQATFVIHYNDSSPDLQDQSHFQRCHCHVYHFLFHLQYSTIHSQSVINTTFAYLMCCFPCDYKLWSSTKVPYYSWRWSTIQNVNLSKRQE